MCLKKFQFHPEMKRSHNSLTRDSKQTSVWENNVSYSLPIPLQSSLHSTEFKTRDLINITWCTALVSSSYPSNFWLVGSFLSGIIVRHSFHCLITVSSCVPDDYSGRGLPTAFFSGHCSFKDVYYQLVMPNYMPYPGMSSIF